MVRQQVFSPSGNKCWWYDRLFDVMRWTKGWATKTPVSCLNIIKLCSNGMGGCRYNGSKNSCLQTHRKSKYGFYLIMFFVFIDNAHVNSHTVYTKFGNDISLLEASENFVNHPCPEKFKLTYLSSSRAKWDAITAKMKAQIAKHLSPVRHWVCINIDRNCVLRHNL